MKKALIIHNPNSGKRKNIKNILYKSKSIFEQYGYQFNYIETEYRGHAKKIIESIDDIDLVISVGGDGTFNEIVSGNIKRNNPFVLSHIPVGTANDLRSIFGLGRDITKNIELILSGQNKQIDIGIINDSPFVYVAGFGKFISISYETSRKNKRKLGYIAYIIEVIKDIFKPINLYSVEYEIDGKKYNGKYSLAIISNANRIAGIKRFYKDVKLDDNKFEVVFCPISKRGKLLKSLLNLSVNDISRVDGVELYRTDNLKITFKNMLRKPWTLDGEKYINNSNTYTVTINRNIYFRISNKACKENCIN